MPSELDRPVGRRTLLRLGLGAGLSGILTACRHREQPATSNVPEGSTATSTPPTTSPSAQTEQTDKAGKTGSSVLVAYFSRPGENYYYGDRTWLDVGNTEVLATTIAELIGCDVYKIEAADPYSSDYDATVARNVREQDNDARPEIANPLPDVDQYDVVLLGSPIWNVRPPMIMSTFVEGLDLAGKAIHPFTTHAMSGLGNAERDYGQAATGATISTGLAIQGEKVADARDRVAAWLDQIGLGAF